MSMAASPSRRSSPPAAAAWVAALTGTLFALLNPGASFGSRELDFMNDKLRIPDSEKFDEATYTATGVGLTFGVDRRLSYYGGKYGEAIAQFTKAVERYPYKAEIWVYLSRAYFFEKKPDRAQEVLKRASALMPDLKTRFWDPFLGGLNKEIRKRASNLQLQVDYYSRGPEDYLNLFRLYLYLEDYAAALNVIQAADAKGRMLRERAVMSAGNNQRSYLERSRSWKNLVKELRDELRGLGVAVGDETQEEDESAREIDSHAQLREATRLLQLRVDYYQFLVEPDDYRELFDNYQALEKPEKAAAVIQAIERAVFRLDLKKVEAVDYQAELDIEEEIADFKALMTSLEAALEAGGAEAVAP